MAITDYDIGYLIRQRLISSAPVSALVVARIRPGALAQNETMPAIRYEVVNGLPWANVNGPPLKGQTLLQIDCYGDDQQQAVTLADAVKNRLNGYRGTLGSVLVYDCIVDREYDQMDPPLKGTSQWRYRRTVDFFLTHSTAEATLT